MFSYGGFTTCLCFVISLRICSALPHTSTHGTLGHLVTRDDNSSIPLAGDYSFLSFNPKTEADMWNAVMKIKPETFALFFSPDYPALQEVLASGSSSDLVKLVNDVFANNIASDQQSSSDVINEDTNDELGAPADPHVITQHGYQTKFFDYKLGDVRMPRFAVQGVSFTLFAQITQDWVGAGTSIDAPYPRPIFQFDSRQSSVRSVWTLRSGATRFTYEDLIGSAQIFGVWAMEWQRSDSVPGTAMQLLKQNKTSRQYEELAAGDWILSAATSSTDTDVPTSR